MKIELNSEDTFSMRRGIGPFVYAPRIGDKISDANHTKEGCEKLAEELEKVGYKTKINNIYEDKDYWTVAIIDVPDGGKAL